MKIAPELLLIIKTLMLEIKLLVWNWKVIRNKHKYQLGGFEFFY